MGRKVIGPLCCVMHVKEPRHLSQGGGVRPMVFWNSLLHIVPQHIVKLSGRVLNSISWVFECGSNPNLNTLFFDKAHRYLRR